MPNTLLTSDVITRTALTELHENCDILAKINRQYDDRFAKDGVNGKVGNQIRIRKPAKMKVIRSWTHTPQDYIQEEQYLTVQAPYQVPLEFTQTDLTLDIHDFGEQVIRPAVKRFSTEITSDIMSLGKLLANGVYNGSGLDFDDVLEANSKMYRSLAPDDEWFLMLDTGTNKALVSELKGLFQSADNIADQYKKGVMGIAGGFMFYRSNLIPTVTNPADLTGATITVAEGGSTATIGGLTDSQVVPAGFRFTVAGSFKVHPEKQDIVYTDLYEFVVLEDATVSGTTASVSIYPVWGSATDARRNISAIPGAAAAITPIGGEGDVLVNNFAFHKDAFTFATIDLEVPKGIDMGYRETMDGVSMRIIRDYDSTESTYVTRLDVLAAFAVLRETFGCALINPA